MEPSANPTSALVANFPGAGGLSLNEVRDALRVFAGQPNLAAIQVAGYNPELDPDGQGARFLIDLLADVLATRIETGSNEAAAGVVPAVTASANPEPPVSAPASPEEPRSETESIPETAPEEPPQARPESAPDAAPEIAPQTATDTAPDTATDTPSPGEPDSITS